MATLLGSTATIAWPGTNNLTTGTGWTDRIIYPKIKPMRATEWYAEPTICNATTASTDYISYKIKCRIADSEWIVYGCRAPDPRQRLRDIIAARQAPQIIVPSRALPQASIAEMRARNTLRKLVGDDQYRNFLRRGFISIDGPSGKRYVVRPGHTMVDVYHGGKQIDRLCIQLKGDFPPTDAMISRCLMIWNQEQQFWGIANKQYFSSRQPMKIIQPDQRPLVEIYRELRRSA